MIKWRSLKSRVTFSTLLIFVASIWLLGFFVGRLLQDDILRMLSQQQFTNATFMATEADRELLKMQDSLIRTAGLISPILPDKPKELTTFLQELPVLQLQYTGGLMVVDRNNHILAEVPATGRQRVDLTQQSAIASALHDGRSSIGSPQLDTALNKPVFSMAVPIRDETGGVVAALAGFVDLSRPNFLDQITEHRYGDTGYYLLQDPANRRTITATGRKHLLEAFPEKGHSPLLDRFAEGFDESGVFIAASGEATLASARRIPSANWYIVAAMPSREAFAVIHNMQRYMLLGTTLLTVIAGGLTWWILRRELSPMLAAVKTLAALSDTEQPPPPLPVASHDEIGELIDGFNHLLETLRRHEVELQTSLRFQQVLIDAVPSPLFYKDTNGRYLGANKAFERHVGVSREDLLGKTVFETAPQDLAERYALADQLLMEHPGEQSYESSILFADGSRHDVIFNNATFTTGEGKVAGQIGVILDITERKQAEEKNRFLAYYDQLTELPNRRLFNDRLNQTMAAGKRNQLFGAVLFIDLDNFKPLNDTRGHAIGDLLLIEVAERLRRCVREIDTVSRFGGDEFVVLVAELGDDRELSAQLAMKVAEKIRQRLSDPYHLELQPESRERSRIDHHCTASIGFALFKDREIGPNQLLKQADNAMYQAKQDGRNQICRYDDDGV